MIYPWVVPEKNQIPPTEEISAVQGGRGESYKGCPEFVMKSPNEMCKSLRPSMILKMEKLTERIMKVLKDEYVNLFGELDKHILYNLSSGVPLPDNISENILAICDAGKTAFGAFVNERLIEKSVPFHDPIPRHKFHLFSSTNKQVELRGGTRTKTVEVKRDMLGKIFALFAKTERVVNFKYALQYPLCAAPLSLANRMVPAERQQSLN